MKHNSDPILDFPGCLDHSNLAEDLSSHSGGSLKANSLVLGFATAEPSLEVLS